MSLVLSSSHEHLELVWLEGRDLRLRNHKIKIEINCVYLSYLVYGISYLLLSQFAVIHHRISLHNCRSPFVSAVLSPPSDSDTGEDPICLG